MRAPNAPISSAAILNLRFLTANVALLICPWFSYAASDEFNADQ